MTGPTDDAAAPGGGFDPYRYSEAGKAAPRSLPALVGLGESAFAMARRAAPRLFAAVVAAQLVSAALVGLQVILGKLSIQAVLDQAQSGGDLGVALPPLIGLALASAATGLIAAAQTHLQRLLGEKVLWASWIAIFRVTTTVTLAEFESPAFFDDLQRIRANALTRPLTMVNGLVQLVGGALTLVVLVAALFAIEPLLLPILLLAAVPMLVLSRRSGRVEFQFAMAQTPQRRRRVYLEDVLSGRDEAKEVRAFDLAGPLQARWQDSYTRYFRDLERHVRRRIALDGGTAAVTAIATSASLGLLVWLVFEGHMALSSAGAALIAIRLLAGRIQTLFTGVSALFESSLFMRDLNEFMARAPVSRPELEPARPAAGPLEELRAESVSFRYPGTDRDVLSDVSLTIRAGEVIALVGENGSGKTTLAKLLAQMFEPEHGRVAWNGADCRELDPATIRPQIGVIFQDYVRYQLLARENIGLGRPELVDDIERVLDAAHRAGAHEHLASLPDGYETTLGKEFFGGYDLSGGQWQRVALARLFFRDAPLLILDEPTASLDARSEHRVFERVQELAHGRSVLLISHRFSTVRSADRIYVLDGGRVIEAGSHDELVALGGRYAELFELQARAYR
ncbi:MAG TPA: ABC transporter ATP-binding protein [Solirubrobacteraceae bacterium]